RQRPGGYDRGKKRALVVVDVGRVHPRHPQTSRALKRCDAPLQDGVLRAHDQMMKASTCEEWVWRRASVGEPAAKNRQVVAHSLPVAHPRELAIEEEVRVRPVAAVSRHE